MNPDITAIIPTYTNSQGCQKLLHVLAAYAVPTVLVDNKPTDEKRQLTSRTDMIYLPQSTNTGFAKAVNLGAKQAKTDWLVILNDDIELAQNPFPGLVDYANTHHLDAVSPLLLNNAGQPENVGYTVLPIGQVLLNFDKTKLDQTSLDGLTAACLVIKRAVFEKIGGFDERFFAYLEDVDLFLRLKKRGYRFGIDPDISVIHQHMTTSTNMGNFKQKQDLKNWFLVIGKNWGAKSLLTHLPGILLERGRNFSGLIKSYRRN